MVLKQPYGFKNQKILLAYGGCDVPMCCSGRRYNGRLIGIDTGESHIWMEDESRNFLSWEMDAY